MKLPRFRKQSISQPGIELKYISCNDLPYDVFKKCCVDKQYSLLGYGDPELLEEAWIKLYSEFCIISDDENIRSFVQEYARLTYLESRTFRTKCILSLLIVDGYNEEYAEWLRAMGYRVKHNTLDKDLERIQARIMNDEAEYKNLITGVKKKQQGEGKEATYSDFDEVLNQIERAFKVPVNPKELTAQMYAIKIKDLKEYCRTLQEKQNG